MDKHITITMKYNGDDVDNGTMAIEDMIAALQGFSGAYGKIVKHKNIEAKHELRITGIQKGSCELVIDAQEILDQNVEPSIAETGNRGVYDILEIIDHTVHLMKHVKKENYDYNLNGGNNTVEVINADGSGIEVPYQVFELFKTGAIAEDIKKIVSPIEEGKIDSGFILSRKDDDGELKTGIDLTEKAFFEVEKKDITKTDKLELTGILNSLTKTTNKGRFILSNSSQVTYFLAMDRPEDYYHLFAHKGSVRVKCYALLDESLTVTKIDIIDIEKIQLELF
ncbi:hypothetical protein ACFL2X_01670 [Candidatus Latescibacterota bacterium]